MRVTRMPYLQPVNGKYRVRVVVPPELIPIIGQANLTKALGTGNEREAERLALPHLAQFMAKIDNARSLGELREIDKLALPEQIRRAPAAIDRLLRSLPNLPVPASQKTPEPVLFRGHDQAMGPDQKQARDPEYGGSVWPVYRLARTRQHAEGEFSGLPRLERRHDRGSRHSPRHDRQ